MKKYIVFSFVFLACAIGIHASGDGSGKEGDRPCPPGYYLYRTPAGSSCIRKGLLGSSRGGVTEERSVGSRSDFRPVHADLERASQRRGRRPAELMLPADDEYIEDDVVETRRAEPALGLAARGSVSFAVDSQSGVSASGRRSALRDRDERSAGTKRGRSGSQMYDLSLWAALGFPTPEDMRVLIRRDLTAPLIFKRETEDREDDGTGELEAGFPALSIGLPIDPEDEAVDFRRGNDDESDREITDDVRMRRATMRRRHDHGGGALQSQGAPARGLSRARAISDDEEED